MMNSKLTMASGETCIKNMLLFYELKRKFHFECVQRPIKDGDCITRRKDGDWCGECGLWKSMIRLVRIP